MSNAGNRYVAGISSDARSETVRVAFVSRRTSAAVRAPGEEKLMTYPDVLLHAVVAIEVLIIFLVLLSLAWNAPLEELADPMHTPNPAKAPWYFLGLQELLHYFPPVVAGVAIPGLVIIALIIMPYFDVNITGEGFFLKNRPQRLKTVIGTVVVFSILLAAFQVWVMLVPTLVIFCLMLWAAIEAAKHGAERRCRLAAKPISFWIMTWFLAELVVLTAVGTFFRGPGWSWVLPWRPY